MIPLAAHSRRTCILYVAHILSYMYPYIPLNLPYKLRDNQLHITPSARFYCGHIPIVLQCPRLSTWELPIYTLVFAYILLSRYIESGTCLYSIMLSCASILLYWLVFTRFRFFTRLLFEWFEFVFAVFRHRQCTTMLCIMSSVFLFFSSTIR